MSGQFYRAVVELLGGSNAQQRRRGGKVISAQSFEHCSGPGCNAVRALPAYAQKTLVCRGTVWLAYIRNDWADVAPSYPVPDGQQWHCARAIHQFSRELRVSLRHTTHLCGDPEPRSIACGSAPCVGTSVPVTPACSSTCSLAVNNFSCGSRADPCAGCTAAWSVPTLCDSIVNRTAFCDETAEGAPRLPESEEYHTAHCMPWSSLPVLRQFRTIVINAGAHRVPTAAYRQQMRRLSNVMRAYMARAEGGVAVFRTTVPGFSGCNETRNHPPHPNVEVAEAFLRQHPFYQQHEFVPVANRIAGEEVRRVGGLFLDVYPGSVLRLDDRAGLNTYRGGIDCLHYRYPLLNTSLELWARYLGYALHRWRNNGIRP